MDDIDYKKKSKELAMTSVLFWIVIAFLAVFCANQYHELKSAGRTIDYLSHKAERHDYFFHGANKRGLLTICPEGVPGQMIMFKEDCPSK